MITNRTSPDWSLPMTSAQAFLTEFAKEIVHNIDTRPQIVQQWTEKLEAREAELGQLFYRRFEDMVRLAMADMNLRIDEAMTDPTFAGKEHPTAHLTEKGYLAIARKAAGIE